MRILINSENIFDLTSTFSGQVLDFKPHSNQTGKISQTSLSAAERQIHKIFAFAGTHQLWENNNKRPIPHEQNISDMSKNFGDPPIWLKVKWIGRRGPPSAAWWGQICNLLFSAQGSSLCTQCAAVCAFRGSSMCTSSQCWGASTKYTSWSSLCTKYISTRKLNVY